jgi:hypothetical protein
MSAYIAIFRALLRWSYLLVPLLVLMVALPLAAQLDTWNSRYSKGLFVLMPFISTCVGGLLGAVSASLMPGQIWRTVPAYGHRIVTVCLLTSIAVWLPLVWSVPEAEIVARVPWTRWTALWCYGALGVGFVSGGAALYLRSGVLRCLWIALVLILLSWTVPNGWSSHAGFRRWGLTPLAGELPFFSPLGLICLLVGPMSWPLLAWMLNHGRQSPSIGGGTNWLKVAWNERGEWSLPLIARTSHGRDHLRSEFLVFPAATLSFWTLAWMPVAIPPILFLWFLFMGEPGTAVHSLRGALDGSFIVGMISQFGFALVPLKLMRPPGQTLLLPGQPGRASLPRWWFERYLMISIIGASAVLFPVAGWALWLNYSPVKMLLFGVYWFWTMCSCISVIFWRMPLRARGFDWLQFGLCLTLLVSTGAVADLFLNVYSSLTCLAVMGIAFMLPWALYRQGVKRWQRMDYGA